MRISEKIEQLKKEHNINSVYFGTGDSIDKPHILYYYNDGLNSWQGYNIVIKPTGDGYMKTDQTHLEHRGL